MTTMLCMQSAITSAIYPKEYIYKEIQVPSTAMVTRNRQDLTVKSPADDGTVTTLASDTNNKAFRRYINGMMVFQYLRVS